MTGGVAEIAIPDSSAAAGVMHSTAVERSCHLGALFFVGILYTKNGELSEYPTIRDICPSPLNYLLIRIALAAILPYPDSSGPAIWFTPDSIFAAGYTS